MEKKVEGIYDGFKELGTGKMLILGFQHVFAMFGATVLVPLLTGLSVSVTLFCAGIGTIWFYIITKRKIPIFLGSSFAFIGAFNSIANGGDKELLPYATLGVVCAGLIYVILAALFAIFGAKKVMKLFPPVVTGPVIILIGLILAGTAVNSASANWILAIIAIAIVICVNLFGKGMIKILPILIGILGAYVIGCIVTAIKPDLFGLPWIDWSSLAGAKIFDVPPFTEYSPLRFLFGAQAFDSAIATNAIVTFVVVALAAMVEHIGDICAIGATCDKNFIADPGLTRTLLGDGIGTSIAGLFGGPANTTYSENTGVVALTKVYDPKVMLIAAIMTIILSFVSIFDAFINTIPWSIIGGISMVLYGMISATGVRTIMENKVDYTNMRNILITALILVCGLGFNANPLQIGRLTFGGLAVAAVVGIVVNAILPGKDYTFDENIQG
ncbi:MAG: solute carrier family 23 protein [Eubacteriales bacterium]|nr:solute carrier family 23 protein [Eubacteriales bacterium]